MLLKKEINLNYLENWPEHYYEIKDINERGFVCLKDHKRADLFMRGWINSKTLTTENIHFFNKKE